MGEDIVGPEPKMSNAALEASLKNKIKNKKKQMEKQLRLIYLMDLNNMRVEELLEFHFKNASGKDVARSMAKIRWDLNQSCRNWQSVTCKLMRASLHPTMPLPTEPSTNV